MLLFLRWGSIRTSRTAPREATHLAKMPPMAHGAQTSLEAFFMRWPRRRRAVQMREPRPMGGKALVLGGGGARRAMAAGVLGGGVDGWQEIESLRMGAKDVSARWLKASRAMKKRT